MSDTIAINERIIGPGRPVYCIAEMSANHHQDFDEAVRILHAAKETGADAVKLQTYTPDTMTIRCDAQPFMIGEGTIWAGRNLHDLYGDAYTPWDWHPELASVAREIDIDLFSTAFDVSAVAFLEEMNVPVHKIASFELVDIPLIEAMARTGKPLIISTGMGTRLEIESAVQAATTAGATQMALLKCTSAYPAPPEEMNLRTLPDLARRFHCPAGLSDHSMGIAVPAAAVALGACIVEKHFTLSRARPGPDSPFSLEPDEFKAMVQAVRVVEKAVGCVQYEVTERETATRTFRRSLFVVQDVRAGEPATPDCVRSIRPGHGLTPGALPDVLGRTFTRDVRRGTPLDWALLSETRSPLGRD